MLCQWAEGPRPEGRPRDALCLRGEWLGDSEGCSLNMELHFYYFITAGSVTKGVRGLLVQLLLTAVHALIADPRREFGRVQGCLGDGEGQNL